MIKTLKEKRFYDSYPTYGGETSMVPISIFCFYVCNLICKFRVNILSRSVSNIISNRINLSTPQLIFHLVFIESVLTSLNLSIPLVFLRNLF